MRAVVVSETNGPRGLEIRTVPEPLGADLVVIEVKASGVGFPDLLLSRGEYQLRPELPFVLGSEVSGLVISAPLGSGFVPGQRVIAITTVGGYAERVSVPTSRVLSLPPELSFEEGAAMIVNHHTMEFVYSVRTQLDSSDIVLVLGGAGGVGSAAVQLAHAHGARVIAGVRREGAEEYLRELGADEVVRMGEGWVQRAKELAGPGGIQMVIDPVGGDLFDEAIKVLEPGGRYVVIGFAAGTIPTVKVNRILFRNISIVGAAWGEYVRSHPEVLERTQRALALYVAEGLRPQVGACYRLEDAVQALTDLHDGKILGKAVLAQI